jgi:bifunctional non-homologous end joining protein LigD
MPLEEYRKKRNFAETPEPAGRPSRRRHKPSFVVQKHDASHLHYDFRLEIGGVLVSWAVPKGPSMNPAEKRLAIRTEDHPLEYAEFEGIIPEGQYGAGTVMVWDRGTYQPKDGHSPDLQLAHGKIDVVLKGQKLCGGFALVRTRTQDRHEQWLLIKERDVCSNSSWDIESPELDRSVLTGRTLKEIAEGQSPKKFRVARARA